MLDTRGHPRAWVKAAGYWTRGIADAADKSLDA
jgi:NADPH-dependent ferric siderophore reductase